MNRFFNTAGPCVPGKHHLLDTCGAREGGRVIFDRPPDRTRDERVFWSTVARNARPICVAGA